MPTSGIACLGMNHNTAPVELRERFVDSMQVLTQSAQGHAMRASGRPTLLQRSYGSAFLSTCNRVEVYTDVEPPSPNTRAHLIRTVSELSGTSSELLEPHLYYHTSWDAVAHLHRVACGLESQVLGESEILGQVANAFVAGAEQGALTPALSAAFQSAIRSGKRARHETSIGENPASIGSVAVSLAKEIAVSLANRQIVIIGAGAMANRAARALFAQDVQRVSIVNRTVQRAQKLASDLDYSAYGIGHLATLLAEADVVISATSAPHVILDATAVQQAMDQRPSRTLVLVDIAVPRDIETDVGTVPGVHLFDVDDLRQSLDESLAARQREAPAVEGIIEQELAALAGAYRASSVTPLIVEMRALAEEYRRQEFERTRRYLKEMDEQTLSHVEHLSKALVNRILHEPTVRLKEKASDGDVVAYAKLVRDLFGLPDQTLDPDDPDRLPR